MSLFFPIFIPSYSLISGDMSIFVPGRISGHESFTKFRKAHPIFAHRTFEDWRARYPVCRHVFRKDGFLDDRLCIEPGCTYHDVANDPDDRELPMSFSDDPDIPLHMIPFTCCKPCSSWWDSSAKEVTVLNGLTYNVCCSDIGWKVNAAGRHRHLGDDMMPGEMPMLLHGYERRLGFPLLHDYQAGVDELSPINDFFNQHTYLLPLLLSFLPEQTRCHMYSTYNIRDKPVRQNNITRLLTLNRTKFDLNNFLIREFALADIAMSLWSELSSRFESALHSLAPTSDLYVPWATCQVSGKPLHGEFDPKKPSHVKIAADHTSAHVDYISAWAFMGRYMNPDKGHGVYELIYHDLSSVWFEERLHMCQDSATRKVVQARLAQMVIGMWYHPFDDEGYHPSHVKLYPAPEYEFAYDLGCNCPCEGDDLYRLQALAVVGANVIDWRELCERTKPFYMWSGGIFGCDPFRHEEPWYTHTHIPLDP